MPDSMPLSRPKRGQTEVMIHPAMVRRRLLAWYDKHRRSLPWRAGPGQKANPYHVLVSEAMLQQTQVATVIDYFNRFVGALPTLQSLAEADEQRVLTLWQGLGYYRRARNLHAAARVIIDQYGGRVPATAEDLIKLPGIGRYTAGAIASIAYDRPAPILDGNVARVLSRLCVIDKPTDTPDCQKTLWSLAEQMVPAKRAGDFNQALMELGALVCSKASPTCPECPLSKVCGAFKAGLTDELPVPARRKAPTAVHHHVLAIERRGRFLFEQRPDTGLWSNMWQLPTSETWPAKVNRKTITQWTSDRFGLKITQPSALQTFKHQTTHRTIHFHLWRTTATAGRLKPRSGQWRAPDSLDDLPLPNPQHKAVETLRAD